MQNREGSQQQDCGGEAMEQESLHVSSQWGPSSLRETCGKDTARDWRSKLKLSGLPDGNDIHSSGAQVSLLPAASFVRRAWWPSAIKSKHHPILAHIIPMRRCNLSCAYCNEYDKVSDPVPTAEMLRRIGYLAGMGTGIITVSGGEPLLHPDLDEIIQRHPPATGRLPPSSPMATC